MSRTAWQMKNQNNKTYFQEKRKSSRPNSEVNQMLKHKKILKQLLTTLKEVNKMLKCMKITVEKYNEKIK